MARVALITFSDGRDFVYRDLERFTSGVETEIGTWLEARGHEVVHAAETVTSSEIAVREARRIADTRPDLTIFNIPVWAFPHFRCWPRARRRGRCCCSPTSTRSTREWSGCWPARARSTRSGAATGVSGATSPTQMCARALDVHDPRCALPSAALARLDLRPHRRPADGHVHRGLQHATWLRAVRRRRRGDRPVGDRRGGPRRSTRRGSATRARWLEQHAAGVHYDGAAADARAARAADPLLLRDARADRRVEPRLLRDQGSARADRPTSRPWT